MWALKHTVPPQNGDFCTVSEVGSMTTNATFSPFDKNNPAVFSIVHSLEILTVAVIQSVNMVPTVFFFPDY